MITPTLEIEYRDLASELKTVSASASPYEFSDRKAHHTDLGTFHERSILCNGVRINEIKTNFRSSCRVDVSDACLSDSLHLCLPLTGSVGGVFEEAGISALLKPKTHHYMFVTGDQYELLFEKEVNLAHIEFGLAYFNSLLCPSERWSAELKEKLFRQEIVYSGGSIACRSTNDVIQAILNCQLSGNLRKLFIEAKVLELITLQLQHYRGTKECGEIAVKKSDREMMHDIKSYLLRSFCDEHSLSSLALHFGINEFKLKKNFKLVFGQTIFDFIFDLKMDHAYKLIREGGKLVSEVSREVGYKNPNHFATAFSKKFGVSPSRLKG